MVPTDVIIRQQASEDQTAVFDLVTAAFGQEDEARLIEDLAHDDDLVLALVAELDGQIVGQISFSRLVSPSGALALAPLAVLPSFQCQGIGKSLMEKAIAGLRQSQDELVFVLGDPAYYRTAGFRSDMAARFNSPFTGEAFMAMALKTTAVTSGTVVYAPAFGIAE